MFKAILEEVNSSPDLNKENLIDRIKDELKKRNQLIYDDWKKSEFDINHLFIQDFILSKLAKDDEELLKLFMNQGETLLCVAARHGCIKAVKNLLENGAKTDIKIKYGAAPLHESAAYGHTQIVEVLLRKGAKVDLQSEDGLTALHYAACHNCTRVIEALLEKRADINIQDKDGRASLHYAAECGYTSTVRLLLINRANIDLQDKDGHTPLNYAWRSKYPETAKLLLECGADPSFIHRPKAKKAGVIVGVTVAIGVLIALVHVTTLSLLSGVDISIVSALIIGGIYYEVAYGVSEYSLSSELDDIDISSYSMLVTTNSIQ